MTAHFPNGLVLVGEQMESVSSGAFSISVALGSATDPENLDGSSSILSEMFNKESSKDQALKQLDALFKKS